MAIKGKGSKSTKYINITFVILIELFQKQINWALKID